MGAAFRAPSSNVVAAGGPVRLIGSSLHRGLPWSSTHRVVQTLDQVRGDLQQRLHPHQGVGDGVRHALGPGRIVLRQRPDDLQSRRVLCSKTGDGVRDASGLLALPAPTTTASGAGRPPKSEKPSREHARSAAVSYVSGRAGTVVVIVAEINRP
jgi:hypothetical protein